MTPASLLSPQLDQIIPFSFSIYLFPPITSPDQIKSPSSINSHLIHMWSSPIPLSCCPQDHSVPGKKRNWPLPKATSAALHHPLRRAGNASWNAMLFHSPPFWVSVITKQRMLPELLATYICLMHNTEQSLTNIKHWENTVTHR